MDGHPTAATPDLAAILATLSQFTNPAVSATPTPDAQPDAADQYDPATAWTSVNKVLTPQPQASLAVKPQDPRLRPQSRSATASPKPMIDPATIITWQEGLRCVTKIAAQNAQFSASMRRMIDDQRKHEMRWYQERQTLKQTQASRATASAQAQSILQSLGNGASTVPSEQTQTEKDVELEEFDRKIYAAQVSMEAAMTAELKGLGVPFFGTRSEKVRPVGGIDVPAGQSVLGQTIAESDLLALRRKMVVHLEDLYRD